MLLYSLGLFGGIVVQTWGIIRYLISRQDKMIAEVYTRMNRRDEDVHNRFTQTVSKDDYHRDVDRLYGEIKGTRDEVANMSRSVGQLILTLTHNGRER